MESVHLPKPLCRVPAAPAIVLSEARGYGRGRRPGLWAVGGAGKVPSRRKPCRGLRPPQAPRERQRLAGTHPRRGVS